MKKTIAILIIAIACLLCSCGKSEAVKKVEQQIDALGEISIDNKEEIEAAEEAYNNLSEKEKEKVENYNLLQEARAEINAIIAEEARKEYESIFSEIDEMNSAIDGVVAYTTNAWSIVGPEQISYFMYLSETVKDVGDIGMGSSWKVDYPLVDKVFKTKVQGAKNMSAQKDEIRNNVIPHFLAYQETLNTASGYNTSIPTRIKNMSDNYGEYKEAIDALSKYYVDSGAYYEYAIDLSGKSLVTYQSGVSSCLKDIASSKKAAELAKTTISEGTSGGEISSNGNYDEIDKLLQGTWECFIEEDNFWERLVFENGSLDYSNGFKDVPEKDDNIKGTYRITQKNIVTTLNNHDEYFDYELNNGELTISIDYGESSGRRTYTKTN